MGTDKQKAEHKGKANLRPWKPGQSGNPNGRPKKPSLLEEIVKQFKLDPTLLPEIATKYLETCKQDGILGLKARQDLIDRLDGKAIQGIQFQGEDGQPLMLVWPWEMNGNHPPEIASGTGNGSALPS